VGVKPSSRKRSKSFCGREATLASAFASAPIEALGSLYAGGVGVGDFKKRMDRLKAENPKDPKKVFGTILKEISPKCGV
jgi:hypothetical protein